jgi:hypothetical protein
MCKFTNSQTTNLKPTNYNRPVPMEPARVALIKVLADILRRAPAEDAALVAWRLVAGPKVEARTTALDFRDGVLRVRVPDATWRSNLELFAGEYLKSLNSYLTTKASRIAFVLESHTEEKRHESQRR